MIPRWAHPGLLCCAIVIGMAGMHGHAGAAPGVPAMQATPVIHVSTTELPPLSMDQRAGGQGALYEMVEELARRTGASANIQFVPWRRALFLTASRARSAVFPLTRSPEREAQFRWLAPLYRENFVFISLKSAGPDSAKPPLSKTHRIAVLRGSLMISFLHQQGYPNIVEASSVEEGLRFLQRGIVDSVCSDLEIFGASLGDRLHAQYITSATVRETSTWLGGSLDFTDADALRFEEAMKTMIDDGSYARILKKYKLNAASEK